MWINKRGPHAKSHTLSEMDTMFICCCCCIFSLRSLFLFSFFVSTQVFDEFQKLDLVLHVQSINVCTRAHTHTTIFPKGTNVCSVSDEHTKLYNTTHNSVHCSLKELEEKITHPKILRDEIQIAYFFMCIIHVDVNYYSSSSRNGLWLIFFEKLGILSDCKKKNEFNVT